MKDVTSFTTELGGWTEGTRQGIVRTDERVQVRVNGIAIESERVDPAFTPVIDEYGISVKRPHSVVARRVCAVKVAAQIQKMPNRSRRETRPKTPKKAIRRGARDIIPVRRGDLPRGV
jgi:hypothetical protein